VSPHDPARPDAHLDPELLALLALGEQPGSPDELAAAQRHLGGCGQCSSELDELGAVARTARTVTPDDVLVAPPDSVWEGIAAELAPPTVSLATARRRRPWLELAAAACLGLVVGGAGVFAATGSARTSPQRDVVASAELAPLSGSSARGMVQVVSTGSGDRVDVDVSGLAAADGFYEVWLLDKDGTKLIALGVLDGDSRGEFAMPPGVSMTDYPIVDVSLEPSDGNPGHSHDSRVRGSLGA
jgi:hypothetical protein